MNTWTYSLDYEYDRTFSVLSNIIDNTGRFNLSLLVYHQIRHQVLNYRTFSGTAFSDNVNVSIMGNYIIIVPCLSVRLEPISE